MGGLAALIQAATYVAALVLLFTVLLPAGYSSQDADPIQNVAFLADNQAAVYTLSVLVYVACSVLQVVLTLALHERLKAGSPAMMQTATAFGVIWAGVVMASGMVASIGLSTVVDLYGKDQPQAASVWLAIESVQDGLGGGTEIVGGLWVLLLSWAALRAGGLPRALNYLGVVTGVAGILTVFPALDALLAVFGLGIVVWFVWVGILMFRGKPSAASLTGVLSGHDINPEVSRTTIDDMGVPKITVE
jgi:hypothetical protein